MALGPSVNIGTDRVPVCAAAPGMGDYSPTPEAIGFFNDERRVRQLLRSLPSALLWALAAFCAEEMEARGQRPAPAPSAPPL
jgi:hypothetical protein